MLPKGQANKSTEKVTLDNTIQYLNPLSCKLKSCYNTYLGNHLRLLLMEFPHFPVNAIPHMPLSVAQVWNSGNPLIKLALSIRLEMQLKMMFVWENCVWCMVQVFKANEKSYFIDLLAGIQNNFWSSSKFILFHAYGISKHITAVNITSLSLLVHKPSFLYFHFNVLVIPPLIHTGKTSLKLNCASVLLKGKWALNYLLPVYLDGVSNGICLGNPIIKCLVPKDSFIRISVNQDGHSVCHIQRVAQLQTANVLTGNMYIISRYTHEVGRHQWWWKLSAP